MKSKNKIKKNYFGQERNGVINYGDIFHMSYKEENNFNRVILDWLNMQRSIT